jgi:hypothetical protein
MIMRHELFYHARHINFGPYFHDLAINDPEDINPCDFYLLACRRNTGILALVCSLNSPTGDDLVIFGNPVVNGLMVIWEGIEYHCHCLFEFLSVLAVICAFDFEPFKIGGQKFVQDGHISPIRYFVVETTNESLVCCG